MSKKLLNLLFFTVLAFSGYGQKLVKGYVLDEVNQPLVGATVQIKGTEAGVVTGLNGDFQLSVPDNQVTLVISFVGFITKEVSASKDWLEVVMEQDASTLNEVEVNGFNSSIGQARRRVESIQKIPESVYALTSDDIEISGVSNLQSFAQLVPNVSFQTSQNVGVNFINVRGIPQIRNGESPIAFVVDGVFIPDANLINQELFDLAMVEVVKGPQGTLYGKNAIGGAINISTFAPTNHSRNKVTIGYGNGNTFKSQFLSSGAIVKDKFYYRLSGSYKTSDGVITNETLNEEVDFLKDLTLRGQLTYHFSNRFSANLSYQRIDMEGGATYYSHSNNGVQLDANDFDSNIIDADQRGESTLKNSFGYLKLEYFFDDMTLKSVTSINNADRNHRGDLDFTPADILRQIQDSNSETFNQEVRLSSTNNNSKLSWDLGVFYQNTDKLLLTDATADFGFFVDPFTPSGTQSLLSRLSDFTNNFETIAFFGFADYKISDNFTASLGLRYDSDKITQENRLDDSSSEKNQGELQPKLSLSYQANDNVLVFVNYGRGYRSGGFNAAATDLFDAEFEGETSDSYEIGLKTSTSNKRLIFNLAGFYVNFNNQQQYIVGPNSAGALLIGNFNFDKTTVTGIEADIKFRTSKYLDIIAGYGLTKSIIDESSTNGTIDRSGFVGNNTPFIPQSTFNVALQSNIEISDNVDFNGFINLTNKGEIYWHEDNNDVADAYSLLNTRIGITINKRYSLSIWGNNLTDVKYFQEYSAGELSGSVAGDLGWVGQPRTYGLDLSIKF